MRVAGEVGGLVSGVPAPSGEPNVGASFQAERHGGDQALELGVVNGEG